jgi:hypothetical protein
MMMMMMMLTIDDNDKGNDNDNDDDDYYKSKFFESCLSVPLSYAENLPP